MYLHRCTVDYKENQQYLEVVLSSFALLIGSQPDCLPATLLQGRFYRKVKSPLLHHLEQVNKLSARLSLVALLGKTANSHHYSTALRVCVSKEPRASIPSYIFLSGRRLSLSRLSFFSYFFRSQKCFDSSVECGNGVTHSTSRHRGIIKAPHGVGVLYEAALLERAATRRHLLFTLRGQCASGDCGLRGRCISTAIFAAFV